jgi:ABC-2 type transport system permease protein
LVLLWNYLAQYLLYLSIGHGAISLSSKSEVLPLILPGDVVPVVMNSLGFLGNPPGEVAFFLIGALVAGSHWSVGTVKTALLQAPARASSALGQALAVALAAAVSVMAAFAVALFTGEVFAFATARSFSPAAGPFPSPAHLFGAMGGAVLIALAWSLTGWAAATWFRSTTAAFGAILLWYMVLQSSLDQFVIEISGPLRDLYDLLPDAATNTFSFFYGYVNYDGGGPPFYGSVSMPVAVLTLLAYAVACVAAGVVLTWKRDMI